MQITCKCLNVIINSKGSIIENYDFKSTTALDHPFFKESIGCVELDRLHKEQSALVQVDSVGQWLVHCCLGCSLFTHALDTTSTAILLVNRAMLTKPQEINKIKNSDNYSPVFHMVINSAENSDVIPALGRDAVNPGLQQQLTEWLQRESALTEERVRQYSERQFATLETLRSHAHADLVTLNRILLSNSKEASNKIPVQFGVEVENTKFATPKTPVKAIPVLPDPAKAISPSKPEQVSGPRTRLAATRKPSVDAEGLFDLDGMEEAPQAFMSDDELSDTDDSGSHDEGIHIPRRVSATTTVYAKSLPIQVPTFHHHLAIGTNPNANGSHDSAGDDFTVDEEPMDIAASIKALAKSVHGDAVFGDLPRPRFSSQI